MSIVLHTFKVGQHQFSKYSGNGRGKNSLHYILWSQHALDTQTKHTTKRESTGKSKSTLRAVSEQSAQFSLQSCSDIRISINVMQHDKGMHLKTDFLSLQRKTYHMIKPSSSYLIKTLIVLGRKGTHLEYKSCLWEDSIADNEKLVSWERTQGSGLSLLMHDAGKSHPGLPRKWKKWCPV